MSRCQAHSASVPGRQIIRRACGSVSVNACSVHKRSLLHQRIKTRVIKMEVASYYVSRGWQRRGGLCQWAQLCFGTSKNTFQYRIVDFVQIIVYDLLTNFIQGLLFTIKHSNTAKLKCWKFNLL